MSNGAQDQPLAERVEAPHIPKDAARKMSHLQEQFNRAEVEQCKFFPRCWAPLRRAVARTWNIYVARGSCSPTRIGSCP